MDAVLNIAGNVSGLKGRTSGTTVPAGKLPSTAQQQLKDRRLREQCSEFESMLYTTMLQSMRKTIDKSELFYGGQAEDIFTSMLDDEYAKIMSKNSRNGVAEALYQQLKRQQTPQRMQKPDYAGNLQNSDGK
jgi:flagellar protein FlgJ